MYKKNPAYKYASVCASDTRGTVPKYVRMQAESWLNIADGFDKEALVDEEAVARKERLLKLIIHPDLHCSAYEGIEPYAWFFIIATLCTKMKNKKDIRYYTTAILKIARKNFKTFNAGVIFILLMLEEPDFSRFFSVAPDLALSSELKLAIRKIIKSSPALYDEVDPAFDLLRSEIRCKLNDNEYKPLAYSEDRLDGKTARAFLADEAGGMDTYPIEAMRSSQINIPNKLGIVISTEYPNDNNGMIDEVDKAKKVLDGLRDNKRIFSLLYEPDDELKQGDIWMHDDRVLYQANPVSLTNPEMLENLKEKRTDAILYENKRENFLCKHCNILYKGLGVEGYVDVQKVKLCKREKDDKWWKGRRVWLGLDLSLSEDHTSVAMLTEDNGYIYAQVTGFLPKDREEVKSQKEGVDYKKLAKLGNCIPCGGEVIDYTKIEDFILGLGERLGVEIVQVGYDRWNAISTVQKLEAAGIECVEIKQHSSILHAPTKLLLESILNKKFVYDDNRLLEINFQNAKCTTDTNLNKYVNKKKSSGKVDMVVATINATYLIQQEMLYGMDFVVQVI